MKINISAIAMITALGLAGAAGAQTPPVGGPDAKGNAPVKATHTVNDGAGKPGANSFTEGQARDHIAKSGYGAVSPLAKAPDGTWRGTASKDGVSRNVALDFKGNVTDGGPVSGAAHGAPVHSGAPMHPASAGGHDMAPGDGMAMGPGAGGKDDAGVKPASASPTHRRVHHRRRHGACATHPSPKGVACSGIDRNQNGISDKEDRARSGQ